MPLRISEIWFGKCFAERRRDPLCLLVGYFHNQGGTELRVEVEGRKEKQRNQARAQEPNDPEAVCRIHPRKRRCVCGGR